MARSVDDRWTPGIGDPSVVGWATVFAYFAAAILAYRAVRIHKAEPSHTALRTFWLITALAMFFLGINKQLDLQSLFTQLGRDMAVNQGWYEQRRQFQTVMIGGITLLGFGVIGLCAFLLRRVIQARPSLFIHRPEPADNHHFEALRL